MQKEREDAVPAVLLRGDVPRCEQGGRRERAPRLSLGARLPLRSHRLTVSRVMLMLEPVFHKTWPHAAQSSPFIWYSSQKIK